MADHNVQLTGDDLLAYLMARFNMSREEALRQIQKTERNEMNRAVLIVFEGEPTEEQQKLIDELNESSNVEGVQTQKFDPRYGDPVIYVP